MRRLWKNRKKISFTEYQPKSQLIVPETRIEKAVFPVIDAHTHFGRHKKGECFEERYDAKSVVEQLKFLGVCHCVDLTLFDRENWDRIHEKTKDVSEFLDFCAPIDFSYLNEDGYADWIRQEMDQYVKEGAVGFKIWKELGMTVHDKRNKRLCLDFPALDPIWEKAKELGKPIVIHVADPPAFFEKADASNERLEEIRNYPFWHHYEQGYSFEALMEQLDRLLTKCLDNHFLIAHCCSWPSNLGFLDDMLYRHANLYTDIAAVLSELGRQPRQFRKLVEKYPDRFLFGTDYFCDPDLPHLPYFRFLETEDEYFPYSEKGSLLHGRWNIYGCGLDETILRKIYYENAVSFFGLKLKTESG